ncbi:2-phosphosulfolactate phosphatase [Candidatus Nanohaloarchaea archaeon]|nr:2-phosphosulfolactate phosphatase [Candidatus Nanohaloarchaea archaeon]
MVFGDVEMVHRVEDIPHDRGVYVIVDVKYFSSTVVELFSQGIEEVHVSEERGDEHRFKEENPGSVIGGPTLPGYEVEEGYDFFNSPASVRKVEGIEDADSAALTSSNGGRAINRLMEKDEDPDIFVGSTTNARPLGKYLRENMEPSDICIVPCGSKGVPAAEDYIGAVHISAAINQREISDKKYRSHTSVIRNAKGPYQERHEHRQKDADIASNFNSCQAVPRAKGRVLEDIE